MNVNETISTVIYNALSNVDTNQGFERSLGVYIPPYGLCVVGLEVSEGEANSEEVAKIVSHDIRGRFIRRGFKKKYGIDNGTINPIIVSVEIDFK